MTSKIFQILHGIISVEVLINNFFSVHQHVPRDDFTSAGDNSAEFMEL